MKWIQNATTSGVEQKATRLLPLLQAELRKNPPHHHRGHSLPLYLGTNNNILTPDCLHVGPNKMISTSEICIWVPSNHFRFPLPLPNNNSQSGVTVKVVSQPRWCHSQGSVTVKVVSQSRWCHSPGGVTLKVVSQSRWVHSQRSVTVKVVSQSGWCHSQGGVTANVVSQSR